MGYVGTRGLEPFLTHALRESCPVDLHLITGSTFEKVKVTGMDGGVIEVTKTVNKKERKWVIVVESIVWGGAL